MPQSAYLCQQSESAIVAMGAASGQSLYRCTEWWIVEETQGGRVIWAEYVRVLGQQEVVGLFQTHGQSLQQNNGFSNVYFYTETRLFSFLNEVIESYNSNTRQGFSPNSNRERTDKMITVEQRCSQRKR